jgi:hypothetical protein
VGGRRGHRGRRRSGGSCPAGRRARLIPPYGVPVVVVRRLDLRDIRNGCAGMWVGRVRLDTRDDEFRPAAHVRRPSVRGGRPGWDAAELRRSRPRLLVI